MGARVGDGGGAHTGFVGEYTPGTSGAKSLKSRTQQTAGNGFWMKGTCKNRSYCLRQLIKAQEQNAKRK